ncbi:MAG TPA: substrate-binding domain-containing protein [Pseudolabrys sp.]|jgi:molybdate transport system substrate-binding protein|nr:substrate-binding domain-containing protein [Pseudolabrys sp.]
MPSEIRVLSGGAPKEVFAVLTPIFERQSGNTVTFVYDVITALHEKIAAGEKADVLIMPAPVLDGYATSGKIDPGARATFGAIGLAAVVREGAPKPDISTKEKFRDALLAAGTVVHATPGKTPSGTHMGKVMEQLGIADAMAKKVIHKPALEGGVELVANGKADIGIYPASEVAAVKGLAIVGPLPAGIELTIVYAGAAVAGSADAAAAFVKFMASSENRAAWKNAGFDPPR